MGRINIEIDEEKHKKLKHICVMKDTTISEYVNDSLKKEVENGRRR